MKNSAFVHLFFFTLLALTSLTACDKDEKDPAPTDGNIEGTWELTSLSYEGNFMLTEGAIPVTIEGKNINDVQVTFKNDGTVTSNGKSFTIVMASKLMPDEKLEMPTGIFEEGGTWEKEGDILYITDFLSADRTGIPITELSSSTLRLSGNGIINGAPDSETVFDIRLSRKN